ncbi:MAG: CUAEP/CCAEP-tail radical SAM (seleno)protein [Acidobacteriota bacterium]
MTDVVLFVSTYDLGRQPFGVASPAAWLRREGIETVTVDLSRDDLSPDAVRRASGIAFYLPMHTATRLALPVIDRVRAVNPAAALCAYGLYAPLNAALLHAHGVDTILGPEAEPDLVAFARRSTGGDTRESLPPAPARDGRTTAASALPLPRIAFVTPDRSTLPELARYAQVRMPDGTRVVTGGTEASRGCKHRCRHCPIVPVYGGRFRAIPMDVVLADVAQQVAAGARHISFGDPDFLNGPTHARRIVEALHATHPRVTYDATIKVSHLLEHRAMLPVLAATGCLFVTSAVESVDNAVLSKLEKGHTREDFVTATELCRSAGLALAPTFVAFTPWTTGAGYRDLLTTVEVLNLVEHVAPIQLGLRLLVTSGSRLLELDEIRARVGAFDARTLTFPWTHADPAVDRLQQAVMQVIGVSGSRSRQEVFDSVWHLASSPEDDPHAAVRRRPPRRARSAIPYLEEPWYC